MNPPVIKSPLFLLDYDGTLAEIVADPMQAVPHREVPDLLKALSEKYPLYVISGRKIKDLEYLLPATGLKVVGVHGMEEGSLGGKARSLVPVEVSGALEGIRENVHEVPGLKIEDKGLSIAFHYREVENEDEALKTLRAWAEALPEGLEALWGKKVVEVRPKGFNKGKIAARLAGEHPDRTPVFLGDDTTDEEAFAVLEEAVTVKVGPGSTAARYRLDDVEAAVAYLKRYLAAGA